MCLAESLFCSNNILNTAYIYIYIYKVQTENFGKTPQRPNWPKLQAQKPKLTEKPTKTKTNQNQRFFNYFSWFRLRLLQIENFDFSWPDKKNRPNRTEPITTLLCMALLFCSWETWLPTREWLLLVCVVCMLPSWSRLRSRLRKSSCRWEPMGSCWWGLDPTIVDCCTHYYTSSSHRRCQL